MRNFLKVCLALAVAAQLARPAPARAGVDISVNIGLPAAPPLVVVQPGLQVVEDWDEEVFFVSGFYWVRRDGVWFRAPRPQVAFVRAPPRSVPVVLVKSSPGKYVKYKKAKHDDNGHHRGHDHGGNGKHKGHKH